MNIVALFFSALMILLCLVMVPLVLYQMVREHARLQNNLNRLVQHDRALQALTRKYQLKPPQADRTARPGKRLS
ncbi:MAG: hypothetical protein ACFE0O_09335 [Opitutales bacterium]